jgi:hypothetical protein
MRQAICVVLIGFFAGPLSAAVPRGTITGRVDHGDAVVSVVAVDRELRDKQWPGSMDATTGEFNIKDLPLATYDVIITTKGAILEGVNLKVPRSDYEEEQPLSKEDIEAVKKISHDLNKFENKIEVLGTFGNIQHAVVVLNNLRTDPFYESKPGEIIWRLEVWRFEKPEEHWVKRSDELATVHYRKRMQKSDYARESVTLEPLLGGIELTDKQLAVKLDAVALPASKPGVYLRPPKAAAP